MTMEDRTPAERPDYEPEETTEDAHEHGVVLAQVEAEIPLLAEDADEDDEGR